jgi:deoxyhypusine synthase
MGSVKDFITRNYRHFNAAVIVDAAKAWEEFLDGGGKMMLTLGGAMSTAELGISIAELIRRDKVHALCVTGANLEEDFCNLIAHDSYERVPHYRNLTAKDELALLERGLNRVTDTCIPEEEAFRKVERFMVELWQEAERTKKPRFPHEFFYELIRTGKLAHHYQIDPRDSWLVAATEKNLPVWTPGWEDSTFGNFFVSQSFKGGLEGFSGVRTGFEQMQRLVVWYQENDAKNRLGFFQIGGGISGDFPICVVPVIRQDLHRQVRCWGYFCQISESATSYGSYSGAAPSEKITWEKLDLDTPKFVIESDATIVFPLVAAYLLDQ